MRTLLLALLVCALSVTAGSAEELNWYRGNTHCHSNNSDGNASPSEVAKWYRSNHFDFIVLTDHNRVTDVSGLPGSGDFIVIPGEEVSDGLGKAPLHVNGLGMRKAVEPRHGSTKEETLQNDIDAVREAGGVPQLNHPGWRRAYGEEEMAKLKGVRLFELYNYNDDSNNFGAGGYPGTEEIWDGLLSRGLVIYGVASDDAHSYQGLHHSSVSYPGKAWVMVRAPRLDPDEIVKALDAGRFYATNGVTLGDVAVSLTEYAVTIKPQYDNAYTTLFIGKGGKVLKTVFGLKASYTFKGDELYVRAKILSSSGAFAVTQPAFVAPSP